MAVKWSSDQQPESSTKHVVVESYGQYKRRKRDELNNFEIAFLFILALPAITLFAGLYLKVWWAIVFSIILYPVTLFAVSRILDTDQIFTIFFGVLSLIFMIIAGWAGLGL